MQSQLQILGEIVSESVLGPIVLYRGDIVQEVGIRWVKVQMLLDCFGQAVAHEAQVDVSRTLGHLFRTERVPIVFSFSNLVFPDEWAPLDIDWRRLGFNHSLWCRITICGRYLLLIRGLDHILVLN